MFGLQAFGRLPRELRDEVYRYIVISGKLPVDVGLRGTDYGKCEGMESIRAILHASECTAWCAREAYEVFFQEMTFRMEWRALAGFLNRKTLHLRNEGCFDIGAWVGSLVVTGIGCELSSWDGVENLRRLLECPRLHTLSIQMQRPAFWQQASRNIGVKGEVAEVCGHLREKMGGKFKVEERRHWDWLYR